MEILAHGGEEEEEKKGEGQIKVKVVIGAVMVAVMVAHGVTETKVVVEEGTIEIAGMTGTAGIIVDKTEIVVIGEVLVEVVVVVGVIRAEIVTVEVWIVTVEVWTVIVVAMNVIVLIEIAEAEAEANGVVGSVSKNLNVTDVIRGARVKIAAKMNQAVLSHAQKVRITSISVGKVL
jgi:hypothetical protein